jgi:SAM-dependent methyltransferase
MVDIRPLPYHLPGLEFIEGDITRLPFADGEIASLSSICVIEHIGLGRYGDTLDTRGSEKAAAELTRVLSTGGDLYITAPIDSEDKVYFNAHRAFTPNYIKELFPLRVIEERYLYGDTLQDTYDATKGFGTGFYHFKK